MPIEFGIEFKRAVVSVCGAVSMLSFKAQIGGASDACRIATGGRWVKNGAKF